MTKRFPQKQFLPLLLLFLALLCACSDGDDSTQVVASEDGSPEGTVVVAQDPQTIQLDWESGAHADTFVVSDDGTNSTCARCHAPLVWVPTIDDMPESCATCKFDVEEPPPFLAEEEWRAIECHVCHQGDRDEVSPEIAWLEIAQIEEYQEVTSVDELCNKCHSTTDILGHVSVVVGGDHYGYSCTQCHSAHSTVASCNAEGCHAEMPEPISGHDEAHAGVHCVACHDSSGLEIGPDPDTAVWTTFISPTDEAEPRAFISHTTQVSVDCERCHFAGNTWGLSEVEAPTD